MTKQRRPFCETYSKEAVKYFREIFGDEERSYKHYCDINRYITVIMRKPLEKLSDSELQIRLFIEMED